MSKNYSAEIVAVGTELLLGQISNTNAQWISEKLADVGIHVYFHSVVGDNLERVKDVFQQAARRSDIVLVTGGLGPTDDDLTREAFQKMTGFETIEDKNSMEKIEAFFKKNNREMTANNRKQSLVFEGANVYSNQVGMAPGMNIAYQGVQWFFMPGVPKEMKSIMEQSVLPDLKAMFSLSTTIRSRMLRFIGIGESQLEHDLHELIEQQSNPTIAPLAAEGEVALRLTAKAESEQEAFRLISETEKKVFSIVEKYYYGQDEETLSGKIIQLLKDKNWKIAAAESLTGGKFSDSLISVPGASEAFNGSVVSYTAEAKINLLRVPATVIETEGTVSGGCAKEMAVNIKQLTGSEFGISFTGVAGPDSIEGKEVGTVYIALHTMTGDTVINRYQISGDRETIRNRAVKKGLELLWKQLKV